MSMGSFSAIKDQVEQSYPLPVASAFRKARMTDLRDIGGRHKNLVDLFEVVVKFLAIVQLQELRRCFSDLKNRLPQQEKTLEFLKHPSLGGWVGLLRVLSTIKETPASSDWNDAIKQWYCQAKTDAAQQAIACLQEIGTVNFDRRSQAPNAEICNALVTYRNKQLAHAANLPHQEMERRLPLLEDVLAYLLESLSFISSMTLAYVDEVKVGDNGTWIVSGVQLNGVNREPFARTYRKPVDLKTLCLFPNEGRDPECEPVSLEPFLLYLPNPDANNSQEVYVYNDAMRTKLEYVSYLSGGFYYHKEIHSEFHDLIRLKVQPGIEEDSYAHLSSEERSERAAKQRKRAALYDQKGQMGNALEVLEQAIEYRRDAPTLVEMADLQRRLGDPPEAVNQTVLAALEIDPENQDAQRMLGELELGISRWGISKTSGKDSFITLFQYFTPFRLREFSAVMWIGIVTLWYMLSASCEIHLGNGRIAVSTGLMWFGASVIVLSLFAAKRIVSSLRTPLSLQLDLMAPADYEAWYDREVARMFGVFGTTEAPLPVPHLSAAERAFVIGILPWTLGAVIIAGYLCAFQNLGFGIMLKRGIDIGLFYAVLYPALRYLLMSTVWLFRFSRLSLKPTLTKRGQGGLKALSPMIKLCLFMYLLVHCSGWAWSLLMSARSVAVGDIFFMTLSTLGCTLWSIGIPLAIRRAMNESKTKARFAYADHVETAFDQFLETPEEGSLSRFEWLVKHDVVVERIGTWPMGRIESLVLIGGTNIVLILFWGIYVVEYLGRWHAVAGILHMN